MSSKSFVVDLKQSMVIIDPNDFPQNLGATYFEDRPTDMGPVVAYEAANVMPTQVGYRSFFDISKSLPLGNLPSLTQKVIVYQNSNLETLLLALGEYGIKLGRPTAGVVGDWVTLLDTSATAVEGVRRLWTSAIITNKLYLYQQRATKFYAIVNPAEYDEQGASLIAGATITKKSLTYGAGLLEVTPSFLNLSGQVGLFRAKNRLGFWDSDNAVAWSSAVAIEDFTPSTETFAGITTFADVQGRITLVLGSGDGFVIYASRSIVQASPIPDSPERWKGSAIMSEVGVAFDTQVVAAQPDQLHFCITQAGLLQVSNGDVKYLVPEVIDYLAANSPSLSLSMLEGRYLFIHSLVSAPTGVYEVESNSITLADGTGTHYVFPKPAPVEAVVGGKGSNEWLYNLATGAGESRGAIADFEPITESLPLLTPNETILTPCYNVRGFDSNLVDFPFTLVERDAVEVQSKLVTWQVFDVDPAHYQPLHDQTSYYLDAQQTDLAGEDLQVALSTILDRWGTHLQRQADFTAALPLTKEYSESKPAEHALYDYYPPGTSVSWDNELFYKHRVRGYIRGEDLAVESNECRTRVFHTGQRDVEVTYNFTGEERIEGNLYYAFFDGINVTQEIGWTYTTEGGDVSGTEDLSTQRTKAYIAYSLTAAQRALLNAKIGAWSDWSGVYPNNFLEAGSYTTFADDLSVGARWIAQCLGYLVLEHAPEAIFARSPSALSLEEFKAQVLGSLAGTMYEANLARVRNDPSSPWLIPPVLTFDSLVPNLGPVCKLITTASYEGGITMHLYADMPGMPVNNPNTYGIDWEFYQRISLGTLVSEVDNSDPWTSGQRLAILSLHGQPMHSEGGKTHVIEGTISIGYEYVPAEFDAAEEVTVYEMDLSGWGIQPSGGFSFRKTHSRRSSTSCPMPGAAISIASGEPPSLDDYVEEGGGFQYPSLNPPRLDDWESSGPGFNWTYPTTLPLPAQSALFQKGSLALYYPTYKEAVVLDLLLEKFGVFSADHKLVYGLSPVNRVDNTISPVPDKGLLGGSLSSEGKCTIFAEGNPQAYIVYGKLGFYRRGVTFATACRAHFNGPATGSIIVEASVDGVTVDRSLSYAIELENQRAAILNFTRRAKWFNIKIEGQFHLTYLEFLGEARGRR